jgi:hypothetical protein
MGLAVLSFPAPLNKSVRRRIVVYSRARCEGMPPWMFFASSVCKRLKNKEIAKRSDPNVRKRIEGKNLGDFVGKQEDGDMPEGFQRAAR